jgi:hypothetical protein
MAKQIGLGSLKGRKQHLHGLALAAQKVFAEQQIKAKKLELFNKMKSEDAKKIQ